MDISSTEVLIFWDSDGNSLGGGICKNCKYTDEIKKSLKTLCLIARNNDKLQVGTACDYTQPSSSYTVSFISSITHNEIVIDKFMVCFHSFDKK
jgi:hypothetical protein